jgi:hypothetical protein
MQKAILHLFVAGLMRFVFGTNIAGLAHYTTLTHQILDVTMSILVSAHFFQIVIPCQNHVFNFQISAVKTTYSK